MTRRTGFTLVELLVYVLLFGFAAYIMIASSSLFSQWSISVTEQQHKRLQQTLLSDLVMRDVIAASNDPALWSLDQGVFRKQFLDQKNKPVAYDVSYSCSAGSCMRDHGVFDYSSQTWQKRHRSLIARAECVAVLVKPIMSTYQQQPVVQQVSVQLIGNDKATIAAATYRIRSQAVPCAR